MDKKINSVKYAEISIGYIYGERYALKWLPLDKKLLREIFVFIKSIT